MQRESEAAAENGQDDTGTANSRALVRKRDWSNNNVVEFFITM